MEVKPLPPLPPARAHTGTVYFGLSASSLQSPDVKTHLWIPGRAEHSVRVTSSLPVGLGDQPVPPQETPRQGHWLFDSTKKSCPFRKPPIKTIYFVTAQRLIFLSVSDSSPATVPPRTPGPWSPWNFPLTPPGSLLHAPVSSGRLYR